MSEYVTCETVMTDLEVLKETLVELGVAESAIEVHDEPVALHGYQGDSRAQKAHVIIRRRNIGASSNDIGFEKTESGNYRAWVSDFDQARGIGAEIVSGRMKPLYNKNNTLKTARTFGWPIKEIKEANGQIRIRIGR
jgi:hypothetical protein